MKIRICCVLGIAMLQFGCVHIREPYLEPIGPGELKRIPPDGGPNNTLFVHIGRSTLRLSGGFEGSAAMAHLALEIPEGETVKFVSSKIVLTQGATQWVLSPTWTFNIATDGASTTEQLSFDAILFPAKFGGVFPNKGTIRMGYYSLLQLPNNLNAAEEFTISIPGVNGYPPTLVQFRRRLADYWHSVQLQ